MTYGLGTRSYNRSAEKRQMDRERKAFTEKFEHKEIIVGPICNCLSFCLPHELKRHRELDAPHDWSLEHERYKPYWSDFQ